MWLATIYRWVFHVIEWIVYNILFASEACCLKEKRDRNLAQDRDPGV